MLEVFVSAEDLLDKIDKLLMDGPVMDIHHYEQARNTYEFISNNAESINGAGFGPFLGHVQNLLLTDILLRVCRMFESSRNYEMRTFPQVLGLLKENAISLPVSHPELQQSEWEEVVQQAVRNADHPGDGSVVSIPTPPYPAPFPNEKKTLELVERLESELPSAYDMSKNDLSEAYAKLRSQRDKEIAHNEVVPSSEVVRPTFEMLEELIAWAKYAIGEIRKLVLPHIGTFSIDGTYMLSRDSIRSRSSLRRMLEGLGVSLIDETSEKYVSILK